jgi:hypothetical protein
MAEARDANSGLGRETGCRKRSVGRFYLCSDRGEQQMIEVLAGATNRNIVENQKRFWTLFRASVALSGAVFCLIVTGALYAGLIYRGGDVASTTLRLDQPIRVMVTTQVDGGVN